MSDKQLPAGDAIYFILGYKKAALKERLFYFLVLVIMITEPGIRIQHQ